ncbi:hypothetical protein BJ878DRAFT_510195 [Calycina marina]|uniref:Uncharacterized protein n=1 Tax=Calycina marina TaxID=1763456 RepID=A0A9P7Z182_9HELO|nr:hypothetical protein BJ878DRAFT_510195 [Calycina marina]
MREMTAGKGSTEIVVVERFVVKSVNEKGLRVVTSGGVSCEMDSCLWLVGETAGEQIRDQSAYMIQYARRGCLVL